MNYRGSTGYGRKFWEASFRQWGLSMQDDIADGVKWLVDQGIADPKRVAIYGGSYDEPFQMPEPVASAA